MIACPGCGGNVKFDIASQQMSCEYCHSFYDPYQFDSKTSDGIEGKGIGDDEYEVTIFSCPQCGGEILSTDNASAGFCSFCGASTILFSRISKERRPHYIIPFSKTKEDCKKAYSKMISKALFAPKELKDAKCIDSFRGIYMPYWAYHLEQHKDFRFKAKKEYRRGDYVYTDHYDLEGNIDGYYKGINYDASSSFEDNISETIAPYDVKGMKAFTPGFMSGFYADTPDVRPSTYEGDAHEMAFDNSVGLIKKNKAFSGMSSIKIPNPQQGQPDALGTTTENVDSALFPVWFMSYRKGDRVAYATVNGQTGKVCVDIPIDPKKYLIGSLLLAIPLFIIIAFIFPAMGNFFVPRTLLMLTAIVTMLGMIIYTAELNSVSKKEWNVGDKGKAAVGEKNLYGSKAMKEEEKTHTTSPIAYSMMAVLIVLAIATLGAGLIGTTHMFKVSLMMGPAIVWTGCLVGAAITIGIGNSIMKKVPGKESLLGYIVSVIFFVLGAGVTVLSPAHNLFYYIPAAFGAVAIFTSVRDIIHYYNVLSTRRLPQFDKQGGDDRA